MSGHELAIVVVAHDSSHILPRWIDAIETLATGDGIELCVVDSGSSRAERARTEALADGRVDRVVALPNVGFGEACNAGAEATTAPLLLFTNPDSLIASLPARALDGGGLGNTLIGGFGIRESGRRPLAFAAPPDLREQARDLAFGRFTQTFARTVEDPAWVSGSALMIARSDFERIGGFSGDFFLYFEDADLCRRHIRAGGRVEVDPDLVIRHLGGESTDAADPTALRHALDGINRLSGRIYAARHGRSWHRQALYALLALAYVPRLLAVRLARRDGTPRQLADHVACVLVARRALARLGAARCASD